VARAGRPPSPGRCAGIQLDPPDLRGRQAGRRPAVVDILAEEVPGEDGELAGHGDDGDAGPESMGDPGVEGVERTGRLDRAEGRLDEQSSDMALAGMADVAGVGRPAAGLADDRVEAEVADEPVRAGEATNITDESDQPDGGLESDARDRQEVPNPPIIDDRPGEAMLGELDLSGEAVEQPERQVDEATLVGRQLDRREPRSAPDP
jgi:hypothetical protein